MSTPFAFVTQNQSMLRWEPYSSDQGSLAEFTWRHPHEGSTTIAWSTMVSCVKVGGELWLSIRVSNTGPLPSHPSALLTTRPRLLLALREFFSISCEGERCDGEPKVVNGQDLPIFVRYELFDPSRRTPVLVVSPDSTGKFRVDPQQLAAEFMSLAWVRSINSPEDTYSLTREVGGKALSCFGGAARLYLPGFSKDTPPTRHPLLLPERLSRQADRLRLAQALALFTVRRYAMDSDVSAERDRLRDHRAIAKAARDREVLVALDKSLATARKAEDIETLATLYQAEADSAKARNEQLVAQLADLESKNTWLESERLRLLEKLEGQRQTDEDEPRIPDVDSVFEAVEQANELFDDELLILPSAFDSARQSPYKHPARVLEALRLMASVASRKREGLGTSLEEIFRSNGLDYSGGIARTTSKKHRQQYISKHEGVEYFCPEHLKLGVSRDPSECLRIYFTSDHDTEERFVIGHVGEHLDSRITN